jgi:tetratricopeptide (TPR) repeat protein
MKTTTLFAALLLVPMFAFAGNLDAYYQRIQTARWHGDIAELNAVSSDLHRAAAQSGDPDTELAAAVADYRLGTLAANLPKPDVSTADAALGRAQQTLEALTTGQAPNRAEGFALLSSVYGVEIGLHPSGMATLGQKAGLAIQQAEQLAPTNPRVLLSKGIGKLFTPPMFGGSRTDAMAAFNSVIAQLPASQFSATNWGLDDAYIWIGIAHQQAGERSEAAASWHQALSVAPESGWAKRLLAAQ